MTTTLRRRSTLLFAGLCIPLLSIKLLFESYGNSFPLKDQASAFSWPLVAMVLVISALGPFAD